MAEAGRTEEQIKELEQKVERLSEENQRLKQQLHALRHTVFGSRTEKAEKICPDQLNLFNEAEVEAKPSAPEPEIEVPAHKRRKKQKRDWAELLEKFPHEEKLYTLPEEERICKRCGSPLVSMGKEKIRTEVQFIPAQVKIIDIYRESFQCLECRKQQHFVVEKPQVPHSVLQNSMATASAVAHVIVQKYQMAVPLHRQEQEWKNIGLPLSRATMANWIIRSSQDWLAPLISVMKAELLKQAVIHADETPVQVLNEQNRKNTTKSFMWVYTNGEYEQLKKIRIYQYCQGRSGEFARKFLEGYQGILQTDGYAGYEKVPCKVHALCWVHARRNFVNAIPADMPKEEVAQTTCGQAIQKLGEIFAEDKKLAELDPEKRKEERLRLEKSKLEAYFAWLETKMGEQPSLKSPLGKAIQYILLHRKQLSAYLEYGEAAMTNNICERAIRNFTIGRKNWLFSASPKGAEASATIYSIIETCKANGLEPYTYLTYLFEKLPDMDFKIHPDLLQQVMPWSEEVQNICK